MFENMRRNKIRTLEPKRNVIVNDINIKDYDLASVSTIIAVSSIFLLSMKLVVLAV
ncbi:MAG TPA: hypothetical protein HA277_03180 [Methanosphaera sp.]|nr:hypothetical protein [Methanosphaera sp.]HII08021.1 hypothetical protein [Methanosphaera sp.]HIJ15384.1 hypothetical protein [Methanosphaera sp.]